LRLELFALNHLSRMNVKLNEWETAEAQCREFLAQVEANEEELDKEFGTVWKNYVGLPDIYPHRCQAITRALFKSKLKRSRSNEEGPHHPLLPKPLSKAERFEQEERKSKMLHYARMTDEQVNQELQSESMDISSPVEKATKPR